MAGQRNKNAFKFLLQLLILSKEHILGVKKVVWGGVEVFFFCFFFLGGGGGGGGAGMGVSTDYDRSYHFTKNISFRG